MLWLRERPWIRLWLAGLNRPFPSCSKPLFQSDATSAKLLIWNLFHDNEGKRFKKSFSSNGSRYHNSVPGEREISSVNREEFGINNCLILGETKLVHSWFELSQSSRKLGIHIFFRVSHQTNVKIFYFWSIFQFYLILPSYKLSIVIQHIPN